MKPGNQHIVIVGGGFCGMMTAVYLLKNATAPLKITLINSGAPLGRGIAYNCYSGSHMLNVPAGNMGAFPDKPTDFIDWVHEKDEYSKIDKELLSRTFLPRGLYGQYIEKVWQEALAHKKTGIELELIEDMATDADLTGDSVTITLKNHSPVKAGKLVIATGNSEPRNPTIPNTDFFSSPAYFRDSWKGDSVSNLKLEKNILIIGNGLTMVDTVLGLIENGFNKTIYSLSPHGFGILPHRHGGMEYTGLKKEIRQPYELNTLVNLTHKHIRAVRKLGLSAEPIIDSLRPLTQNIWQSLTIQERKQFLNRLRHLWGVARHRLPVHTHDLMQTLRIQGKLVVLSGKLNNIEESGDGIMISFHNRKTGKDENLIVERVINCTGPESSIKKSSNLFLQNIWKKGIAGPDTLELGINADPDDFKVFSSDGKKQGNIFTLGANLRGMLWESTAIPELRIQVEKLAKELIKN